MIEGHLFHQNIPGNDEEKAPPPRLSASLLDMLYLILILHLQNFYLLVPNRRRTWTFWWYIEPSIWQSNDEKYAEEYGNSIYHWRRWSTYSDIPRNEQGVVLFTCLGIYLWKCGLRGLLCWQKHMLCELRQYIYPTQYLILINKL